MRAAFPFSRALAVAVLCIGASIFIAGSGIALAQDTADRQAVATDEETPPAKSDHAPPAGRADTQPVNHVLELFTSQGCVSCPPADAILTKLSRRPDVLALAYHVDYWDYIGWRDTFGSPENTERQRDYAKTFDTTTVYTPQLVVNGSAQTVGSREKAIEELIETHELPLEGTNASVAMRMQGDSMQISANARHLPTGSRMPLLIMVIYGSERTTAIESGANSGHRLVNTHPVLSWRVLGMWSGKPFQIDMPAATVRKHAGAAGGCAVMLQAVKADGAPGPILAAARVSFAGWVAAK